MTKHRSTHYALANCVLCVMVTTHYCAADDATQTVVPGQQLAHETKRDIERWVADLDHDEYHLRARAQEELEKLTGSQLIYARQQLTEKLSLEYMTRRERILKTYDLTLQLERVADEIRKYNETGKCEILGLGAFCRIIDIDLAATRTFFELARNRESQNFLITVYAAPSYAEGVVRNEINTAVRSGNRSDWQTDTMALKWISIFLALCDKEVQLDERKNSSELKVLASSLQILSIEFALQDRQHGSILRQLIEEFVKSAGERGEDFAQTHRSTLAAKLQLSK